MARAGMGRPAKPTSLRILHGDHPERINRHEPKPAEDRVEPTQPLAEYAQQVWDSLASDLVAKRVLTPWDAYAFTAYCVAAGTFRQASERLATDGLTAEGSAGGVIKSPYWQIMRDSLDMMVKLGGRFGLTPSDRATLGVPGEQLGRPGGPERLLS